MKKIRETVSPDDVWQMSDDDEVFVTTLTLSAKIGRLTGIHCNPTEEDRSLEKEINKFLSTAEHKKVKMSCKDIRRILNKGDVNKYSFSKLV